MSKASANPMDWEEIHRRLDVISAAAESRDANREKQILRDRARALAREEKSDADRERDAAAVEAVVFTLAPETYCIEAEFIGEIFDLKHITPVPCTPPFIAGVVNLRGSILPVLDIKKFFELPERGITDTHKVITLRGAGMTIGLLADTLLGARTIRLEEVQPSLPTLTGMRADYFRGVTRDGAIVLDVAQILSDSRIIVDETVEP